MHFIRPPCFQPWNISSLLVSALTNALYTVTDSYRSSPYWDTDSGYLYQDITVTRFTVLRPEEKLLTPVCYAKRKMLMLGSSQRFCWRLKSSGILGRVDWQVLTALLSQRPLKLTSWHGVKIQEDRNLKLLTYSMCLLFVSVEKQRE